MAVCDLCKKRRNRKVERDEMKILYWAINIILFCLLLYGISIHSGDITLWLAIVVGILIGK